MGSRGSACHFPKQSKEGYLTITDREMTRFNITLQEGVQMVNWVLDNMLGGELFVPKLPSYKITDVAKAIGPNLKLEIVGIRPGEKIHEEMITSADSFSTIDLGKYYAILPPNGELLERYKILKIPFMHVEKGFSYNSGSNNHFLNIDEIRELIKANIDPDFVPK